MTKNAKRILIFSLFLLTISFLFSCRITFPGKNPSDDTPPVQSEENLPPDSKDPSDDTEDEGDLLDDEKLPVHEHTVAVVTENEEREFCDVEGVCDEVTYCTECGEEISREKKPLSPLKI